VTETRSIVQRSPTTSKFRECCSSLYVPKVHSGRPKHLRVIQAGRREAVPVDREYPRVALFYLGRRLRRSFTAPVKQAPPSRPRWRQRKNPKCLTDLGIH
jgi:hypothetical protein